MFEVFLQGLEDVLQLFLSVGDASHAQAVNQVAHSASDNLTAFAFVELLFFDLLHEINDLGAPLTALRKTIV